MEDKTFELIEKLYNRMEDGFKEIHAVMATKDDIARLEGNMAKMECENKEKFGAIFDGLTANTEAIEGLKTRVISNTEAIEELKIGVTANTVAIEELKIGLAANKDAVAANTEAIVELKTETGANTTAIHELKTEVQSLKVEVKNHEIKLKLVK